MTLLRFSFFLKKKKNKQVRNNVTEIEKIVKIVSRKQNKGEFVSFGMLILKFVHVHCQRNGGGRNISDSDRNISDSDRTNHYVCMI